MVRALFCRQFPFFSVWQLFRTTSLFFSSRLMHGIDRGRSIPLHRPCKSASLITFVCAKRICEILETVFSGGVHGDLPGKYCNSKQFEI